MVDLLAVKVIAGSWGTGLRLFSQDSTVVVPSATVPLRPDSAIGIGTTSRFKLFPSALDWFKRDVDRANARGEVALGRFMADYLTPPAEEQTKCPISKPQTNS